MHTVLRSILSSLLTIPCCAILTLLAAADLALGQTFGEFVPVSTDDSPLPDNLDLKYISFDWRFKTNLDATPANMQRILDQEFTVGCVTAHERAANFMNYNAPGFQKAGTLPDKPPPVRAVIDVYCDWERSGPVYGRFPPDAAPGEFLQTEDGSLRLMQVGPNEVKMLVAWGAGQGPIIAAHPKLKSVLAGKMFQTEPPETPRLLKDRDQDRPFTLQPQSSSVMLTNVEADQLVKTVSILPTRLVGTGLKKPALKILLCLPLGGVIGADPGVALLVRRLRLSSQPLTGKKGIEIPIEKFAIVRRRAKPPLREFATMLESDIDDPEVLDRYGQCPPVTLGFSEFLLPDGCTVPSDPFDGQKPMYQWKNGTPLPSVNALWEVSFGADPEGNLTGLSRRRGGAAKLIGHYYIIVDGRNVSERVVEETFTKSLKMTHSDYSRHLRSSETTMSMDVEVGVDFGLGLNEKFSLSETTKQESERGSSLSTEVEMKVEQKIMPPAGALLLYKIPVLLGVDEILGTSKFTFDRRLSMSPSTCQTVAYRNEAGTNLLKKVNSATDPNDVKNGTKYTLGDVISGDDLNVIRKFEIDDGMRDNRFVGAWRETMVATGMKRRVDITLDTSGGSRRDAILTYRDGPEPGTAAYRLIPETASEFEDSQQRTVYRGTADMMGLLTQEVTKVQFEVRSGPMGPMSKIVIRNLQDDPIAYLVRWGDGR